MRLVSIFVAAFPLTGAITLQTDADAQQEDSSGRVLSEEQGATGESSPRASSEFPLPKVSKVIRTQQLRNSGWVAQQDVKKRKMPYPCTSDGRLMTGGIWDHKETGADLNFARAQQASLDGLTRRLPGSPPPAPRSTLIVDRLEALQNAREESRIRMESLQKAHEENGGGERDDGYESGVGSTDSAAAAVLPPQSGGCITSWTRPVW